MSISSYLARSRGGADRAAVRFNKTVHSLAVSVPAHSRVEIIAAPMIPVRIQPSAWVTPTRIYRDE
jgi:hypothetical protein